MGNGRSTGSLEQRAGPDPGGRRDAGKERLRGLRGDQGQPRDGPHPGHSAVRHVRAVRPRPGRATRLRRHRLEAVRLSTAAAAGRGAARAGPSRRAVGVDDGDPDHGDPRSPPPPPPPAASAADRPPAETGFSPRTSPGSIPRAADIAGGPDLFEEEYGQADVESAIAAFEKAHPEFSYVEDGAAAAAMTPGNGQEAPRSGREKRRSEPEGQHGTAGSARRRRPSPQLLPSLRRRPRRRLSGCRGSPSRSWRRFPSRRDDLGRSAATQPEPTRADEAPTQQIRLSARVRRAPARGPFAVQRGPHSDETAPAAEEHTAEIPIVSSGPLAAPPPGPSEAPAGRRRVRARAGARSRSWPRRRRSDSSRKCCPRSRARKAGLTDDEIDRLASRVVERLSEKIVREIAWEVIPDVAEIVIKQRIKELESGVE